MSPVTDIVEEPTIVINVAVIYYSATGNLHKLAVAAATAAEKAGTEVRLRKAAELSTESIVPGNETWNDAWAENSAATRDVPDAALDDLEWADAVLWGTPDRSSSSSTRPCPCTAGAAW